MSRLDSEERASLTITFPVSLVPSTYLHFYHCIHQILPLSGLPHTLISTAKLHHSQERASRKAKGIEGPFLDFSLAAAHPGKSGRPLYPLGILGMKPGEWCLFSRRWKWKGLTTVSAIQWVLSKWSWLLYIGCSVFSDLLLGLSFPAVSIICHPKLIIQSGSHLMSRFWKK